MVSKNFFSLLLLHIILCEVFSQDFYKSPTVKLDIKGDKGRCKYQDFKQVADEEQHVALNNLFTLGQCGTCVEIEAPKRTITAVVVDKCYDGKCKDNSLGLTNGLYKKIGAKEKDSLNWKFVNCRNLANSKPQKVCFHPTTKPGFVSIQPINFNEIVMQIEVDGQTLQRPSDSSSTPGYYFHGSVSTSDWPAVTLKVTVGNGRTRTGRVTVEPGVCVEGVPVDNDIIVEAPGSPPASTSSMALQVEVPQAVVPFAPSSGSGSATIPTNPATPEDSSTSSASSNSGSGSTTDSNGGMENVMGGIQIIVDGTTQDDSSDVGHPPAAQGTIDNTSGSSSGNGNSMNFIFLLYIGVGISCLVASVFGYKKYHERTPYSSEQNGLSRQCSLMDEDIGPSKGIAGALKEFGRESSSNSFGNNTEHGIPPIRSEYSGDSTTMEAGPRSETSSNGRSTQAERVTVGENVVSVYGETGEFGI